MNEIVIVCSFAIYPPQSLFPPICLGTQQTTLYCNIMQGGKLWDAGLLNGINTLLSPTAFQGLWLLDTVRSSMFACKQWFSCLNFWVDLNRVSPNWYTLYLMLQSGSVKNWSCRRHNQCLLLPRVNVVGHETGYCECSRNQNFYTQQMQVGVSVA